MTALNQRFSISPGVISQEVQLGETILLDTRSLTYFAFDPLGTQFWRAMQSSEHTAEVLSQVAASSELTVIELEKKLFGILAGLQRSGLISLGHESDGE